MNIVILKGNLTRDPELNTLATGSEVVNFGVAVNRKRKDSYGQQQEEVMFVDCEGWGKTAETIDQYFSKGKPILIFGRLKLDTWETQEGVKRSKHKLVVERFEFCGGENHGGNTRQVRRQRPQQANPVPTPDDPYNDNPLPDEDDEIPF